MAADSRNTECSLTASSELLPAAFDLLQEGFGIFDRDLKLVCCNTRLGELLGYPAELCRPGTPIAALYRFHAEKGDYGAGDPVALANARLELARAFAPQQFDRVLVDRRIVRVRYAPLAAGGLLLSCTDITEARRAEDELRESE